MTFYQQFTARLLKFLAVKVFRTARNCRDLGVSTSHANRIIIYYMPAFLFPGKAYYLSFYITYHDATFALFSEVRGLTFASKYNIPRCIVTVQMSVSIVL